MLNTTNPRHAAFDLLLRIERERSYADILIDRQLSTGQLIGPDRPLFTELVYGVLRRQGTLDHIIDQLTKGGVNRLERVVLILLRLGLYQVLYLDRMPVSAAVNETVQLAHEVAPRASGLVNAVLRRADRERQAIPYPDREHDLIGHLAICHSHPRWIVQGWHDQLGPAESEALAIAMAGPAPLTLRANTLRTSRDRLLTRLTDEGATASATVYSPVGLLLTASPSIATLPSYREGLFVVQDESSQLAALLLAPQAGERVLDLCAAPGGKATHLAQLMENRGELVACDLHPRKLERVAEAAGRLGIAIIRTMAINAEHPPGAFAGADFQRILVDAPCSGLGVLRRTPEGKWWKRPEDLVGLTARQRLILANAAELVAPGGILLYATCSTALAEDEEIIADFLSRHPDFVLEDLRGVFPEWASLFTEQGCFRSWPHRHGMDGFFAARLRKL